MKFVIRADGGSERGMGHIYRMLTLAKELGVLTSHSSLKATKSL